MPFSTYSDLKAAVATWLARTDLTSNIIDFVTLARQRVQNELRLRGLDIVVTGALTDADSLALPADRDELRSFEITNTAGDLGLLTIADPDTFGLAIANGSAGNPLYYLISNNKLYMAPVSSVGTAYRLRYYAMAPAQPADNATDALLSQYPSLLLYGSLMEAEPFLKNDERIGVWQAFFDRALASARSREWNSRAGGGKLVARPSSVARSSSQRHWPV